MTIYIATTVIVYCEGGFHSPLELSFQHSPSKTQINDKIRSAGWVTRTAKHYCQEHKP